MHGPVHRRISSGCLHVTSGNRTGSWKPTALEVWEQNKGRCTQHPAQGRIFWFWSEGFRHLGPVHTGRGTHLATAQQIMEHMVVNGSVHTARKQYQRVCMQICSRVLCERGLGVCSVAMGFCPSPLCFEPDPKIPNFTTIPFAFGCVLLRTTPIGYREKRDPLLCPSNESQSPFKKAVCSQKAGKILSCGRNSIVAKSWIHACTHPTIFADKSYYFQLRE